MSALAESQPEGAPRFSQDQLDAHMELLAERVFQVETKWPHFRLLLRDLQQLAANTSADMTVVSLERGLLYGGCSLVAPLFQECNFISVD